MEQESRFLFILQALARNKFMNSLCTETISFLSVFSSDPLFSCIITFCTLLFLYLPHHLFWKIVFSPVLILTGILLFTILRLGAIQKSSEEDDQEENPGKSSEPNSVKEEEQEESPIERVQEETKSLEQVHQWITSHSSETQFNSEVGFDSNSCFVEWNVKAPLEVIYEEHEGIEAEKDPNEEEENQHMGIHIVRHPSLSRYYPESDSDSSSEEGGFPGMGKWVGWVEDEEDHREGLIEIALDACEKNNKRALEFHFDEDNLIEIDISPTRFKEISGEDQLFTSEISCN